MAITSQHRSILAVDIEAYGDPNRTNPIRLRLRQYLTRLLTDLLSSSNITAEQYATSDTGDGLVISVAAQVPAEWLLDPLVPRLSRRLATYNRRKPAPQRMRLRVALHTGRVLADPHPLHGEAVIHTCRLLDSPAVRTCIAATEQPLAVIVSRTVYDDVVKHGYGQLEPDLWHPIVVEVKETRAPAWVHVPGDPDVLVRANVATTDPSLDGRTGSFPRQLQGRLAEFIGREQELARLQEFLGAAVAADSPTVTITAIDGLSGVGKSTLAIEAAWRLSEQFPDGQLYLDLHGSTIGLTPLTPMQALSYLLRSLGADPNDIPSQVEEAAAYFRTLTANRRLLLVLDNAHDAAQVRPLLPAHAGCAVVITSRDTLAFLEGVTRLRLDVLSQQEALELLRRLAGPDRVWGEPDAAIRLVELCGRLPLAIQIAGRRLDTRPGWSLAGYADRLADEQQRLDELRFGDRAVRSSFQLTYQLLDDRSPKDARALRLLSLLDGPDLAVPVATALLDEPTGQVRAILEGLVDISLLATPQSESDRYRFHDLVRVFAREHATRQHPKPEQAAALSRALEFYTATAWHTLTLLRPGDWRLDTADSGWTQGGLRFPDAPAALTWLEAERENLLAAIDQAASAESAVPARQAGQLTRALIGFFEVRGHWHDVIHANQTVLQLGRRTQDRIIQGYAENDLGTVYRVTGRYGEALDYHQDSLTSFRKAGDDYGEAQALQNLGIVYGRLGRYEEAIRHHQVSLISFRRLGDHRGEAANLNNLGTVFRMVGRYGEALDYHQDSLGIRQAFGDRRGEARSLNGLGVVYGWLGRYEEAIRHHHNSLTIYREVGDRYGEAVALRDFGGVLRAAGRDPEAHTAWQLALTLCESLQIPEADEIRARLAEHPRVNSRFEEAVAPPLERRIGAGHPSRELGEHVGSGRRAALRRSGRCRCRRDPRPRWQSDAVVIGQVDERFQLAGRR